MQIKLAIIILNYNSWKLTLSYIKDQLSKLDLPEGTQIVVVDNASSNESAQKLQEASEDYHFQFLLSEKNIGYAAGNNIGLRWAYDHGFNYAWVTNSDIEFENPQTARLLLDVFTKDSKIGVVSPRVYTPSGMETNRNLYRPSVYDLSFGKLQYRKKGRMLSPELKGVDDTYCYNYRSQGCCMMVDLAIMHDVDYMDEGTFLYMEEPILAERLLLKGYKEACALKTKVIHAHSTTVSSVAKRKQIYKWQNDSEVYYYKKYRHFNGFQIWLSTSFTWLYYWVVLSMKRFN